MTTADTSTLVQRLLEAIDKDILPKTEKGVAAGNKIFGAALLNKEDLSTWLAETNNELENPLWHGEMHLLKKYYEYPTENRPAVETLIFLTTHEPCSLCLSAITWAGFDNFYYFFSHEDSRDQFAIPHDLRILKEVFGIEPGAYNRHNDFWNSYSLRDLTAALPSPDRESCEQKIKMISSQYDQLSDLYQSTKSSNDIPLN